MTRQRSSMGGIGPRAGRLLGLLLFVVAQPQFACTLHCLWSGHAPAAMSPMPPVSSGGHDAPAAGCHHQEAGSVRPHATSSVSAGPAPTGAAISLSGTRPHAPAPAASVGASSLLFPNVESPPPRT